MIFLILTSLEKVDTILGLSFVTLGYPSQNQAEQLLS